MATLAEAVKEGIESTGNNATIYQVKETLPEEVLQKMYAPAKPDYPIATIEDLTEADGILFGVPTRFGAFPSQLKEFIDSMGGVWSSGALYHKPSGVFTSTGTGGGQETTIVSLLSTFAHHGMLYVPLGYKETMEDLRNVEDVNGGSAWGAATLANSDGSRQPSELELKVARAQGSEFGRAVHKLTRTKDVGRASSSTADGNPVDGGQVVDPIGAKNQTLNQPLKQTSKPVAVSVGNSTKEPEKRGKKKNFLKRFLAKIFD